MKDLHLSFDEDPALYDRARPDYPEALYRDIFALSGVGPGSRVLEIGTGTGQATLPFLEAGYRVTAVELGQQLAAYARRKFAPYPGAAVLNGDFIDCPLEPAAYDLVYSATAFHWRPEVGGQNRVYDTVDLYLARNEVSI